MSEPVVDTCSECDRDADIVKRVRSGNIGMCKRHRLAHEYLQWTRGPIRDEEDAERVRWLGRALAYAIAHPEKNILEHADFNHVPQVKELIQKLNADRVYKPGEDYDGTEQATL